MYRDEWDSAYLTPATHCVFLQVMYRDEWDSAYLTPVTHCVTGNVQG